MKLKGIYNVVQNNIVLAKSKNQIQDDGFQLIRNWFASENSDQIQRINLSDENHTVSFKIGNLMTQSLFGIEDLFTGYKQSSYYYTTGKNAFIKVLFKNKNHELQTRKIKAIGIDVYIPANDDDYNDYLQLNTNIQVRYSNDIQNQLQLAQRSDFLIPVSIHDRSFVKIQQGYNEHIYYFKEPQDISQLKIQFNGFLSEASNGVQHNIYAINLYQAKHQIIPPTYMSLYDSVDQNAEPVFHKQIQMSYPDIINNSVVFKTTIPEDYFDTTQTILAVSTDYYNENGERKQFSYSQYSQGWQQQAMTNIQLSYQLFFSNQQNSSQSNESNSEQ